METLDQGTAQRMIEQLRFGVPPPDHVRAFTVGREAQLAALEESLLKPHSTKGRALLVRANYGSGKSHLLKVVREMALDAGYAVSLIEINAHEGVRFNRIDTIFGAICRELQVKGGTSRGVGGLFDLFAETPKTRISKELQEIRNRISSNGKWDLSDCLRSPALYVALRAWVRASRREVHDVIIDWFEHPENYRGQRKRLYLSLVSDLRNAFLDPRREWQFYADEVFAFHASGHRQAWDALADFDLLARASGLRGLVLLFDEFEDVIQNLNRRNLQEEAFLNLFRFFDGERFPGLSYFAVTPDFVAKCKTELLSRGLYDFDYSRFEQLPFFEMEPIEQQDFEALANRIARVYAGAYDIEPDHLLSKAKLRKTVAMVWATPSPDRVRRSIQGVVKALDDRLHELV